MKIAIVTEGDPIWSLAMWERVLPELKSQGHEIAGIVTVSAKVGRYQGWRCMLAYLRFGLLTFLKLANFAQLNRLYRMAFGKVRNFSQLAAVYDTRYLKFQSPNDPDCLEVLKDITPDVILIHHGHVLERPFLDLPVQAIINQHAGALPQNRGLWPYVWAVIGDLPQRVSYHCVTQELDAGDVLVQIDDIPEAATRSMIAYYCYVHQHTEGWAMAIAAYTRGQVTAQQGEMKYHGLPGHKALWAFYTKQGKIIRWSDVRLAMGLVA